MWSEALRFAESAASAFDATEIRSNADFLTAASGRDYTGWDGRRRALVACGWYFADLPDGVDHVQLDYGYQVVPEELLVGADVLGDIREKGIGFDCPAICNDTTTVAVCYDIVVRRGPSQRLAFLFGSGGPARVPGSVRFLLAGGTPVDAATYPDASDESAGVVEVCLPRGASVQAVTRLAESLCTGGEFVSGQHDGDSLDRLEEKWKAVKEERSREQRACIDACDGPEVDEYLRSSCRLRCEARYL
jgi:hypothetical protein